MANYPISCPYCDVVVDSMDSVSDSQSDLDYHILVRHPNADIIPEVELSRNLGGQE